MALLTQDVNDAFKAASDAYDDRDQDLLELFQIGLELAADNSRVALSRVDYWERGEPARLQYLKVLNGMESYVSTLVSSDSWEYTAFNLEQLKSIGEDTADLLALMDAIGYDRGAHC